MLALGPTLGGAVHFQELVDTPTALAIGAGGAVAALASLVQTRIVLATARGELLSDGGLDRCFEKSHVTAVSDRDEFALSLWKRVRPQVHVALSTLGVDGVARVESADIAALDKVLDEDVPALRRRAGRN